jgi:transposase-like protein
MNESIISADHFHNEQAAYDFIESKIWPNGPVCPHSESRERMNKMNGKSTRIGTYKCYACPKPFTMKIGPIFIKLPISQLRGSILG